VPEREAFEVLSAERFRAAERFWRGEFSAPLSSSGSGASGASGGSQETVEAWQQGLVLSLARPRLDALEQGCGVAHGSVLLAALAAALLRLDGRDDLAVVAAIDEREPFPVRLAASERLRFRELAQAAAAKLAAAAPHRHFAPSLFASTFRIPGALKVPPVFDVGYLEALPLGLPPTAALERFAAPAYRTLELVLQAEEREDGLALQLLSRRDSPGLAELGEALLQILGAAAQQPEAPLGDLPLAGLDQPIKLPGRHDRPLAALQFNF